MAECVLVALRADTNTHADEIIHRNQRTQILPIHGPAIEASVCGLALILISDLSIPLA